jgi:HK97 family phage major capsid protein
MAAVDISQWIPEEWGGALIERYRNTSAVDAAAGRREPMTTDIKKIPKDSDASVQFTATGQTYAQDATAAVRVQLDAAKLTHLSAFNEEDLSDSSAFVNAMNAKKLDATSNLALLFDNACLAVTGAMASTPALPYASVYNTVATLAAANIIELGTGTPANVKGNTRTSVLNALQIAENSQWASEDLIWIASPAFRSYFRGLDSSGSQGVNLFAGPMGGAPGNLAQSPIAGYPVYYSRSARLAATATYAPTAGIGVKGTVGNAIAVLVPRRQLIVGDRAPLESQYSPPTNGIGMLSDTAYMKMRRRAAFILGEASAAAVIEITTNAAVLAGL